MKVLQQQDMPEGSDKFKNGCFPMHDGAQAMI